MPLDLYLFPIEAPPVVVEVEVLAEPSMGCVFLILSSGTHYENLDFLVVMPREEFDSGPKESKIENDI